MSTAFSSNTAQSVGNAGLPIFSSETQAIAKSPPGRNPNALDVLLITSTEGFLQDGASQLENSAKLLQVPMHTLYVEDLTGYSKEEKVAALKAQLQELHRSGKIDAQTQVIIDIHGTIHDAPHHLSNNQNNFSIGTSDMVSLVREARKGATPSSDGSAWQGTIHINACGAGRASQDLKDGAGITLLYAGKKIKFHFDADAIFGEIIRQLGEYRKDPAANKFPTTQDFFSAAWSVSGEKVHMAGNGNLVQIRSGYLPHPTELTQTAVRERLERSLLAKILHGKPANVQKAVDLLGPALKNVGDNPPLLIALNEYTTDAEEKIGILLRAGVDINQKFASGDTALHVACRAGKKEIVAFLLQQGADCRIMNSQGETALAAAINAGHQNLAEYLIESGIDIDSINRHGDSVLHLACEKGDARLASLLLQRGSDPHLENNDFKTPVSLAIQAGHFDVADVLLSAKSKLANTVRDYDISSLLLVLSNNQFPLFHRLIEMSGNKSALMEKLFALCAAEMEPNYTSNAFDRKLFSEHKIILSHFIREMLYSNESMPSYFKSLLMDLNFVAYPEYLTFVLSRPTFSDKLAADLEEVRSFYEEMGNVGVCQLLGAALELKLTLSERVDRDLWQLNSSDESGFTPFEQACRENKLEKVQILAEAGVDFKFYVPGMRKSALMLACEAGSLDVVKWLLRQGVDSGQRDSQGKSALDYAIAGGNAAIEREIRRSLPVEARFAGDANLQ